MKKRLFKMLIKSGKEKLILDWLNSLNNELPLLKETLREEKVEREEWWSLEEEGRLYIYASIDGEALPSNKEREVNRRHVEIIAECVEQKKKVGMILDIEA